MDTAKIWQDVCMGLNGRIALVTGAARGIGRATGMRLAADGASVAFVDLDGESAVAAAAEATGAGATAIGIQGDVTDTSSVESFVNQAAELLGGLSILVNNAGIAPSVDVPHLDDETWQQVIDTNLTGAHRCVRAALPHLTAADGGRIINFTSIQGRAGSPLLAAYCASKGGLAAYTRALAAEFAPSGITANCVAPGFTRTDLIQQVTALPPVEKALVDRIPLGRLGSPEDIAGLVAWLAGEESAWVTGSEFTIDGGHTAVR